MSIIYEALKKTQDNPAQEEKAAPCRKEAKNLPRNNRAGQPLKKKFTILPLIAIGGGILISWLIAKNHSGPTAAQNSSKQNGPAKPSLPSFLPQKLSATLQKTTGVRGFPSFILQGIILSGEGNTALINDQINNVGDTVNGAKIEEINAESVVLTYRSQKIVLKNK